MQLIFIRISFCSGAQDIYALLKGIEKNSSHFRYLKISLKNPAAIDMPIWIYEVSID